MSEEIHVNSRLHECCRAWCDSASEASLRRLAPSDSMVNACRFSAEAGGAAPVPVLLSSDFDEYQNSEEQRKTEKRAALFRGPRLPPSQDFSGERGDARCKFLGRTAKTAAEPVTLLHVETMLGAAEATRPNIGGIFCGGGDQQRAKHRPQVSSNPRRQRRRLPPAVLSRRRRLRPIRSVRR